MNFQNLSEHRSEEARLTAICIDLLVRLQSVLKFKGFKRVDARLQSAQYHWTFKNADGREIVLVGWHGTGKRGTCRWFGDLKSIHHVYDNQQGGKRESWAKPVKQLEFDIIDGTVEQYEAHLKAVEQYVRAL
jgi:hypothetical protein